MSAISRSARSARSAQAIAAALPSLPPLPAQPRATKTNPAQQIPSQNSKTNPPPSSLHQSPPAHTTASRAAPPTPSSILNPPSSLSPAAPAKPKPLKPRQLSAARLLLAGHSVSAAAAALHIHPYTLNRWKRYPLFHAELRRQTDALARNTAQQKPTARNNLTPFWQNEPKRQPGTPTPST